MLLARAGAAAVLVPAPENASKEEMLSEPYLQAVLNRVVPRAEPYRIAHRSLYPVHQRVAKSFRPRPRGAGRRRRPHQQSARRHGHERRDPGRSSTSPTSSRRSLQAATMRSLDRYDRQRRTVAVEAVQQQTHRNQQIISERDPATRQKALDAMRKTAADKVSAREYMLRSSMIAAACAGGGKSALIPNARPGRRFRAVSLEHRGAEPSQGAVQRRLSVFILGKFS